MNNTEVLLSRIMETINSTENLETIQLGKDVEVEGRTANYPVDLYWEFRSNNGVLYKIVANVKNVDKVLTKNELFQFANILQDLSGQVMGVVFTQPVYDKVIQDVAKDVGILLYEMPQINDEPKIEPMIGNLQLQLDLVWIQAEKDKYGLGAEQIPFTGDPRYMYIYDADGICMDSIEGVIKSYIKRMIAEEKIEESVQHVFEVSAFLETGHPVIPKIKINGLSFDVKFRSIDAWNGAEIVEKIVNTVLRATFK